MPVRFKAMGSLPQPVVRWASQTLALWRFQPPGINGQPIAAPMHQILVLSVSEAMPVDFRNKLEL